MLVLYVGLALSAAIVATVAWRRAPARAAEPVASRPQTGLVALAALCLVPPVLKATFALWPAFEARALPIRIHMLIGDEFWIPFMAVFFATVTFAVPRRVRRALLLATWLAVALVVSRGVWRLSEPAVYASDVASSGGVCLQSTDYTCGAASMVMLLDRMGVRTTEGEMARLSVTVPRRGLSAFQAAYALQRKLEQVGRPAHVEVVAGGPQTLDSLPTPFLAGVEFRLWLDHMICVFDVGPDRVIAGDPLQGRVTYTRREFIDQWLGHAVVVRPIDPSH